MKKFTKANIEEKITVPEITINQTAFKVICVGYNKPNFLPYHYECLKKYLTVPFEYYFFDNSDQLSIETTFKQISEYLNINYIRVPSEIHNHDDPSIRAGKSLDYSLQFMYKKGFKGSLMVIDSDCFLTSAYDPINVLGSFDMIGRTAAGIYGGNEPTTDIKKFIYYTNQFLILNYATLPNFDTITFIPGVTEGVRVDCGGLLHEYFKKNPTVKHKGIVDTYSHYFSASTIEQCPSHLKPFFEKDMKVFEHGKSFSEIFENVFIHLRAGSNWINHPETETWIREDNLFTYLCNILIDWESVIQPNNKYVISFSLYGGDNPKYTYNAIMNALIAQKVYKGWITRFYYDDTVPSNIIDVLKSLSNTETIFMENKRKGSERMLWRFHAASDQDVAVMISRDCDSWLSFREAFSVKDWIQSDKGFHIIRDHCYHSQKIMGGMWGVKRSIIPDMKKLCEEFSENNTYDQGFLATTIYPRIINNVMVHLGNQYTMEGELSNGYFPDGGIPFPIYPKIREFVNGLDNENMNLQNDFFCAHCKKPHQFFIGGMFSNIDNVLNFLKSRFVALN